MKLASYCGEFGVLVRRARLIQILAEINVLPFTRLAAFLRSPLPAPSKVSQFRGCGQRLTSVSFATKLGSPNSEPNLELPRFHLSGF